MSKLHFQEDRMDAIIDAIKSKKTAALLGVIPTLIALRSSLPAILTKAINQALTSIPGFIGSIESLSLQFWRGKVTVHGLVLKPLPQNGKALAMDAVVSIDHISVTLSWSELFAGAIVGDVIIDQPHIYASARTREGSESHPQRRSTDIPWQRQVRDMIPFKINRFVIRQGAVHLRDLPGQRDEDVRVERINVLARNIANNETLSSTLKSTAEIEALVMSSGKFQLGIKGFPFSEVPTFDTDGQLNGLDLRELAFLFKEGIGSDVRSGYLNASVEAAAAKGAFKGYFKPAIDQMHVQRVKHGFMDKVKTLAFKATTKLLRNKQADRIATKLEFQGRFDDPSINYTRAATNFIKNAFAQAFRPRLERSVRFSREGSTPQTTEVNVPIKKKTKLSIFFDLLKSTASRWSGDEVPRLSASLSYYTVFSIAPLLILTIAIAGLVFGKDAAQGQIVDQVGGLVGKQGGEAIQSMIQAANKPASGAIATIISLITLLVGASGVMNELKSSLNHIWRVKQVEGIGAALKSKFMTYAMVLGIGFLLLVSLVVSALMAAAGKFLSGVLPLPEFALQLINAGVSFGVITLLFAVIYRFLPDTRVAWKDVWIGSAVTSLLFTIGKMVIGLYLGKASVSSSYGAAGSVLVVLLWVYYSAMILYFGAEFTKVYADRFGSTKPQPKRPPTTPGLYYGSDLATGNGDSLSRSRILVASETTR